MKVVEDAGPPEKLMMFELSGSFCFGIIAFCGSNYNQGQFSHHRNPPSWRCVCMQFFTVVTWSTNNTPSFGRKKSQKENNSTPQKKPCLSALPKGIFIMFFFPLVQRVLWSKSCPHLALVVPLYIRHACHKKKYNVSLSTCAHTVFQCTLSMEKKKADNIME